MWVPFWTLFKKEVIRFLKVWMHTVLAPVLTGGLYLFVFGEALSKHLPVYEGVSYTAFIIPGLIMMTVLQNAFSNTASSLIQSKISGNLVFILLPAIPGPQVAAAYIGASFALSARWRRALSALLLVGIAPGAGTGAPHRFRLLRCGHHGGIGAHHGALGRKIRSDGSGDEFRHHAAHLPFGRLLFRGFAPALLAGREPPQSLLLLGRRLSAGIFRQRRHQHDAEPPHRCGNGFGRHGGGRGAPR